MELPSKLAANAKYLKFTDRDKQKVNKADPNGGRCLITNTKYSTMGYCQCIPKTTTFDNEEIVCTYRTYNYLYRITKYIFTAR